MLPNVARERFSPNNYVIIQPINVSVNKVIKLKNRD